MAAGFCACRRIFSLTGHDLQDHTIRFPHDMDLRISDLVAALNAEQAKVARLVEANRSIRQNSYTADAVKAMVEGIQ